MRHAHFSVRFFAVLFFVLRIERVVVDTHGAFDYFFFFEDVRIYGSFESVFRAIRSRIQNRTSTFPIHAPVVFGTRRRARRRRRDFSFVVFVTTIVVIIVISTIIIVITIATLLFSLPSYSAIIVAITSITTAAAEQRRTQRSAGTAFLIIVTKIIVVRIRDVLKVVVQRSPIGNVFNFFVVVCLLLLFLLLLFLFGFSSSFHHHLLLLPNIFPSGDELLRHLRDRRLRNR